MQCGCNAEKREVCLFHLLQRYISEGNLSDLHRIIGAINKSMERIYDSIDNSVDKVLTKESEWEIKVLESVLQKAVRELVRRKYQGRHVNMSQAFQEMVSNMNFSEEERSRFGKINDLFK